MATTTQPKQLSAEADDQRKRLLSAVDAMIPLLEAHCERMEEIRGPTPEVAQAFHDANLIGIRAPLAVGGEEADFRLYGEVVERVAYHNFSAAWCLVLYADNTGMATSNLSPEGMKRLMRDGRIPAICGGGGLLVGELTPTEGGYLASGRWLYGSGIPQADYVLVAAALPAKEGEAPDVRMILLPVSECEIEDNWHVLGLKGSGSADFSAKGVFVPEEWTYPVDQVPQHDRPIYKLGTYGFLALGTPPMVLGAARRVLDDLAGMASRKARGYTKKVPLARRGVFQVFLGEADVKLKAVNQLALAMGDKLLDDMARTGQRSEANEAEARAVGTYCAEVAIDIVNWIVRYAGGEGVRSGHRIERTLRDLNMAGTHGFLSNVAYENHSEFLMDLPDARLVV